MLSHILIQKMRSFIYYNLNLSTIIVIKTFFSYWEYFNIKNGKTIYIAKISSCGLY